jgi:hypothetical protein
MVENQQNSDYGQEIFGEINVKLRDIEEKQSKN